MMASPSNAAYTINLEAMADRKNAREIHAFLALRIVNPNFSLDRRCLACSRWDERDQIRKENAENNRPLMLDKPDQYYAPGAEDASNSCSGCWYSYLDEKPDATEAALDHQTKAELEAKLKTVKRHFQKLRYEYPRNDRLCERTEAYMKKLEAKLYGSQ